MDRKEVFVFLLLLPLLLLPCVLGMELKAFHILDKPSTPELHSQL
jgi:hypothetical protein